MEPLGFVAGGVIALAGIGVGAKVSGGNTGTSLRKAQREISALGYEVKQASSGIQGALQAWEAKHREQIDYDRGLEERLANVEEVLGLADFARLSTLPVYLDTEVAPVLDAIKQVVPVVAQLQQSQGAVVSQLNAVTQAVDVLRFELQGRGPAPAQPAVSPAPAAAARPAAPAARQAHSPSALAKLQELQQSFAARRQQLESEFAAPQVGEAEAGISVEEA